MTLGGILFAILYAVVWVGLIIYFIDYALNLMGLKFNLRHFIYTAKRRIALWFLRKKKRK